MAQSFSFQTTGFTASIALNASSVLSTGSVTATITYKAPVKTYGIGLQLGNQTTVINGFEFMKTINATVAANTTKQVSISLTNEDLDALSWTHLARQYPIRARSSIAVRLIVAMTPDLLFTEDSSFLTLSDFTVIYDLKPKITAFTASRCASDGTVREDGTHIKFTAAVSIKYAAGFLSGQSTVLAWKLSSASEYAESNSVVLSSSPTTEVTALIDTDQVFGGGNEYVLRILFGDAYQTVESTVSIPKAHANLDLAASKYGVGIGQVSSGTEGAPKFECAYPAYFYAGISGVPVVQSGREPAAYGTANASQTITFPTAFSTVPNVTIAVDSNGSEWGAAIGIFITSVTATDFTVRKIATSIARNGYLQWIAVGT